VDEGLELSDLLWCRACEEPVFAAVGEVAALIHGGVDGQAKGTGCFFDRSKIDIGGEILLAGMIEGMGVGAMLPEATEGSGGAGGVVERFLVEAVVDPDEEGFLEDVIQRFEEGVEIGRSFGNVTFGEI